MKMLQIIPTLWFERFSGVFKKSTYIKPFPTLFQFGNTKVLDCSECVVCYEITKSKTPCNHTLCYKCNENIKTTGDKYETPYRPCPICRQNVLFEDSDDEDCSGFGKLQRCLLALL